MLVFDHPFRNQRIDRGFRQARRNATPRSISGAIIDKHGPIGADAGQELLTKAVKPGGGKIAPPPQLVHIRDNLFKHAIARSTCPCQSFHFNALISSSMTARIPQRIGREPTVWSAICCMGRTFIAK